jgi:acetate---CoA ligase (ADP-forming)
MGESEPAGLSALWNARSVAIVGASERPGSLGRLPVDYLLRYGYAGRILPVNPNAPAVQGLTCYPSVAAAPGPIDLALLLVAAARVPAAIDDCAAARVPVAIVGSSGFAEAGEPELQRELVRRARAGGVRVVGPNCIGAVGADNRQVVSFSPLFSAPEVPFLGGSLAFVTQSGALGYGTVSLAYERGLGLGWIVNTGNEADVTAVEVLHELASLDECTGLLAYVETMADGAAWRRLAAVGKPIVVLKAGASEAGARAAASHTGALAASDRVVDDVLRQLGIARAKDVDELLDIGEALSTSRRPRGGRVAVVTTSGGSGILAADAIAEAEHPSTAQSSSTAEPLATAGAGSSQQDPDKPSSASGLELARLSDQTTRALSGVVPAFGSVANPVDVTATVMSDPTLFNRCLDLVADDPSVDSLVACFCVLTGRDVEMIVAGLTRIADRTGKPVVVARTGADFLAPHARAALRAVGIPVYATPARAVRALAALTQTAGRRPVAAAEPRPSRVHDGARPVAWPGTEPELKELLAAAGLPVPGGRVVADATDALAAVDEIGRSAVFKAVVPGLIHKTEAGGVALGVTVEGAPAAFDRLAALGGRVYVEEMVTGGAEVLVGVASTPLGQVITVASGGVLTEVIDDAVFRLLPIGRGDAVEMLAELRGAAVLHGARGSAPLDVEGLADLLVEVGRLAADLPPAADLDLNPVMVLPHRVVILDVALTAIPFTEQSGR